MNQLSLFKKRRVSVYPNQYVLEEKANGVMYNGIFFPFNFHTGQLAARPGIRYYIRNICGAVWRTGIYAAPTYYGFYITIDKAEDYYWIGGLPVQTAASDFQLNLVNYDMRLLCKENTRFYPTSSGNCEPVFNFIYAAIDVMPFNLKPLVVEE